MRKIRRATEQEVIAEFLKNEYHHVEFHADRENYEQLVLEPNLASEEENALRRALLFRRRGHMWREIPASTQWWEVELQSSDLDAMRVFPRAQWRKIAGGNFHLREIVNQICTNSFTGGTASFIEKVRALSARLSETPVHSTVILIGIDETSAMTILEGNHRVTAAMLVGPDKLNERFRFVCGLSPEMTNCCWYDTNLPSLYRYGMNRLKNLFYDKDADISRVVRSKTASQSSDRVVGPAALDRR